MKNSNLSNTFFVTVVTFCDIFIQDIKDIFALIFLEKIGFSLKNKIMHTFLLVFRLHLLANSR